MKTAVELARNAGFRIIPHKPEVIALVPSNGSWVDATDEINTLVRLVGEELAKVIDDDESGRDSNGYFSAAIREAAWGMTK